MSRAALLESLAVRQARVFVLVNKAEFATCAAFLVLTSRITLARCFTDWMMTDVLMCTLIDMHSIWDLITLHVLVLNGQFWARFMGNQERISVR